MAARRSACFGAVTAISVWICSESRVSIATFLEKLSSGMEFCAVPLHPFLSFKDMPLHEFERLVFVLAADRIEQEAMKLDAVQTHIARHFDTGKGLDHEVGQGVHENTQRQVLCAFAHDAVKLQIVFAGIFASADRIHLTLNLGL